MSSFDMPTTPRAGCKHNNTGICEQCETEKKEKREGEYKEVNYDGCMTTIGKGGYADREKMLADGILVTDTGRHTEFLEKFADKNEFTPEEIDEIYIETIRAGIIDHHAIDAFFGPRPQQPEKCATQMVADYPEAVLQTIEKHNIDKVNTHYDSDEDAITSAYFVKHLLEHGELPPCASKLAQAVNKLDYGRLSVNPHVYVKSILGLVGGIKAVMKLRASQEISEKGFSPEILTKNESAGNAMAFELYNTLANLPENADFEDGDATILLEYVSEETRAIIEEGMKITKERLAQYERDVESAEQFTVKMRNKQGDIVETRVLLASSKTPLIFTNVSYQRVQPDTIVAVFAGEDRAHGDQYDIGVIPDMGQVIDLSGLTLALNKAEKIKRDALRAKEDKTEEEEKMIVTWDEQKDRDMFAGIDDMIDSGEVGADEVTKKDPTVLVAGGSLVAASRTSLLSEEDFRKTVKAYFEKVGT